MKLGAKADRNGFFYVLDRTDGKFMSATPFVSKITWANGMTEERAARTTRRPTGPAIRPRRPDGKEGQDRVLAPSFLGGKNQMPMAYSPEHRLFYVPSNEWGMDIWNEPVAYKKGAAYLGAGFTIKPLIDDHIGVADARSTRPTGKIMWEYKNKAPLWGGVLTTGGGLVFTGTPEGYLKAFDAKTGKELWKFNTGIRRRRAARHLGTGRRAICRRGGRLGRRGAAVGRRSRQAGEGDQPGRVALGVPAAEELT